MREPLQQEGLSKVPEVTLGFWIIKVAATDAGRDRRRLGHHDAELGLSRWHRDFPRSARRARHRVNSREKILPLLYWATIVASTNFGTTMADFADRSLGIGYAGGSTLLLVCLLAVLGLWYRSQGTISVNTMSTPKVEAFYWAAITFSQTLGTALGDWMADTGDLATKVARWCFGAGLAVIAGLYCWSNVSRVLLFWAAFILTRPLGATVGRFPRQARR